ncbi:tubby-related protein 4-like [Biomphalaria glabrata]|uniref:Tubby-related protein 4-like n=1 Tax=Biomphalaria glabrata TaxID=6526 RepID=A0A9W3ANJ7_BIOGL|nr:tubby-related protein 4-like [Biomphalaria glabrata]XP_055888817.1 tubby-related protein 4-like [Biomphalaria glabrata]
MHVHFEQTTCTRTDSNFLSLSWMGKVPEDLPEEGGGWKLNRAQYYVEGWLASGNARGVVGVTFSTSHCHKYDAPPRSNFNLRGHRSEVVLVRWNEPYQKLATCDSRGVIFVWIKHEGRWSIELINDRNSQVTDFAWSHDGRMALICYRDGFILVGSVAGQRYWSSMLNLDNTSITCGVWSPDDQQVMFGTLDGQIIVMSSTGAVVTQVTVHEGFEISSMAWSCERFNMEEAETGRETTDKGSESSSKSHVLAVCFKYGDIFLMSGYDDVCPVMIYTTLTGIKIDWSNCGEYLAVGGFVRLPNLQCRNEVHFYSKDGSLIHWVTIPSQGKPLTAMTWGHNDKRLFLAAGCHMYVAWVSKQVAPLQFLCQRVVHQTVRTERAVERLPIPQRLKCGVKALFSPTIKSYIPDPLRLREFVCSPPPGGERLFCTMIRHGEETSGGHYTLYLEYLGGLVPLLKGKRASKLRPDFIIYDPKIKSSGKSEVAQPGGIESDTSSESEAEVYTDGCGSPRMQRRRRNKVFRAERVNRSITFRTLDELMYDDNLPETNRLVEVTSNIWGTKFQITGLASSLPACLGQVVYKTSLLHLQPRQMTITISEITPTRQTLSRDPNFTPAPASDDEESFWASEGDLAAEKKTVEVSVHDAPSVLTDDIIRADGTLLENGLRLTGIDTSLIENSQPLNFELTNMTGKLVSSGTVRSRSLSPVRNSLTQTGPLTKPDLVSGDVQVQGARPKASIHKRNSSSHNHGNLTNATGGGGCSSIPSPKSTSSNNKHGVVSNCHSSSHTATSVHCTQNGNSAQHCPPGTNKVEALPSGLTNVSCNRKHENLAGFKKFDLGTPSGGGAGLVGVMKAEELTLGQISKDQHTTGSSYVTVDSGALVDGVGSRWADPAAHAVKLLEDSATEGSDLPFENNLVADCSPTAPHCRDLHRRLYLAQYNIVDTGAPISPSGCPACLPVQFLSDAATDCTLTSTMDSDQHLRLVAEHNLKNSSRITETNDCQTFQKEAAGSDKCSSLFTPTSVPMLSSSSSVLASGSKLIGRYPTNISSFTHCLQCAASVASKRNSLKQSSNHSSDVAAPLPPSELAQNICANCLHNQRTLSNGQHLPSNNDGTHYHPDTQQCSAMTKDLTSFDKLTLILSEEPSAQSSSHNFRSMPGFVMKNPDHVTINTEQSSPSPEQTPGHSENLLGSYPLNSDYLGNHIADLEIQQTSASLPSSPIRFGVKPDPAAQNIHEEILKGRCKHLSPLLGRKGRDSPISSQDVYLGLEDVRLSHQYQSLEAFQKAQLKQKMRRRLHSTSGRLEQARTFTMHNKAPLWNETSQVYQLDFGGRVTQESAKNFQIELRGKQVMQFGRIDNNAYTLDFQYPFTAVQAFAVALANVTQRLK